MAPKPTRSRRGLLDLLPPDAPFVTALDDTHLEKTGTHTPGVAYRRAPLSPPFHTNFIRAQRVQQVSALLPHAQPVGSGDRADFLSGCPTSGRSGSSARRSPVQTPKSDIPGILLWGQVARNQKRVYTLTSRANECLGRKWRTMGPSARI